MIHSELLQGHRLYLDGATNIPPVCQLQQTYYSTFPTAAAAGSDIISPPASTSSRSSFSSYSSYSARRGDRVFSPPQPHSHPQQQQDTDHQYEQCRSEGTGGQSTLSGHDALATSLSRTDLRSESVSTDPRRPSRWTHYSPNTPAEQHLCQSQLGHSSVREHSDCSKSVTSEAGQPLIDSAAASSKSAQKSAQHRHPMTTSPIPPMQPGYMSQLATYMAEMVVYLWFSPPKQRRAPAFAKPSSSFRRFCQDLLMTSESSGNSSEACEAADVTAKCLSPTPQPKSRRVSSCSHCSSFGSCKASMR